MGEKKQIGVAGFLSLTIGESGKDFGTVVKRFEWRSFVNNGYIIRATMYDTNHSLLRQFGGDSSGTSKYLKEGRKKPLEIKFKLSWSEKQETSERIAYMIGLRAHGSGQDGLIEFVAIDPPNFLLQAGKADGRVYEGNVSDVIKQTILDFTDLKDEDVNVSETQDNKKNKWYMHRQDPKTFIMSLLDWSSSTTKNKSRWIVSSRDKKLNIKEEADLTGKDFGVYDVANNQSIPNDTHRWDVEFSSFVSVFQTQLLTTGISSTSGQYFDRLNPPAKDNNEPHTLITDKNTSKKRNIKGLTEEQAFSKPSDVDWATHIMSIPEHSGGDVGIPYSDYISGRSRQRFMDMTSMIMRIAVVVNGDHLLDDSELLGVSTCSLNWRDASEAGEYFLHGCWLVYGFSHTVSPDRGWETTLYLYRIDHDAASDKRECPHATS